MAHLILKFSGLRDDSAYTYANCNPNREIQLLFFYFFSNRVIDKWNNLDQDTVDAPSLNSFKNRLNKIRSTRMGFFMD